ncbi:MAG: hypothetical protein V2I63_08010 [Pseudomonadales bacterium]|jgi:hypothetical protein|nr:hypothetical protein [Pseudomonadales bacterium]
MRRRHLGLLALALLLPSALAVFAEPATEAAASREPAAGDAVSGETAPGPAAEEPAQAGADATPAAEPASRRAAPRSPDVFVPTEEVSEDLSVSFPVDI